MRLGEYQERARETDQNPRRNDGAPGVPDRREVIPLLGLVGEVGSLLSEYKKLQREVTVAFEFEGGRLPSPADGRGWVHLVWHSCLEGLRAVRQQ